MGCHFRHSRRTKGLLRREYRCGLWRNPSKVPSHGTISRSQLNHTPQFVLACDWHSLASYFLGTVWLGSPLKRKYKSEFRMAVMFLFVSLPPHTSTAPALYVHRTVKSILMMTGYYKCRRWSDLQLKIDTNLTHHYENMQTHGRHIIIK
jgi:hypothetical protein